MVHSPINFKTPFHTRDFKIERARSASSIWNHISNQTNWSERLYEKKGDPFAPVNGFRPLAHALIFPPWPSWHGWASQSFSQWRKRCTATRVNLPSQKVEQAHPSCRADFLFLKYTARQELHGNVGKACSPMVVWVATVWCIGGHISFSVSLKHVFVKLIGMISLEIREQNSTSTDSIQPPSPSLKLLFN